MNATKSPSESVAVRDHAAADEQDRRLREQRQEAEQRDVERALPVRLHALHEDGLGALLELRLLGALLRERLDDVDADDVLLGDGRDVGHLLLHVAEQRMGDVAVPVRDRDQHRRDRERDQRELPRDDEDDDPDADDREDVLEEEDQAVAEEEADALQVDRRAAHQLAGLVAVVEAEREPDELRVDRLPHVELDRERLLAGDQPAAGHHQRARDAEREHERDEPLQPAELVRVQAR